MKTKWQLIGYCGVDSGTIALVDPCYVLPEIGEQIGYTYNQLLDECWKDDKDQLPKEIVFKGKSGNGVVVGGFGGDGNYPVYAKKENGYIVEVKIKFN